MTTPVYLTGFEHGATLTTNGGGLAAYVQNVAIDSTEHNTGAYSLKATPTAAAAYLRIVLSSPGELVGRLYFKITTEPASDEQIFDFSTTNGTTTTNVRVWANPDTNVIELSAGSTIVATSPNNYSLNQWHYIDFSFDINQNPWVLKAKLDGGTEFSGNASLTADTFINFRLGGPGGASTLVAYYDDVILITDLADYPIGPGGTEALVPSSDGTHNAGTAIIQNAAGVDIGSTAAYDEINQIPPSTTFYIKQIANGTGNYAEVAFGNIVAAHSAILGAMGVLAYTSEGTSSNRGACMISKDGFSTFTAIHGDNTTTADYSDGSTANLYFKSAILANVVDDTTVNALTARLGYSGDANPDPYWIDLVVEVAYLESTTDINLDLVTFANTYLDVTVLENIVEALDLVSYSSTFPDMTLTENIDIDLDLVSYSSTFPDLTVTENEVVPLDLVSYLSTVNDLTVLEHEIVPLDLVSYSSSFPDVSILENEVVLLDLVTYASSYPDVVLEEQSIIDLDLVTYSSSFPDLTVLENEIIVLDLVSYSSSVQDLTVTENEIVSLDLVTYSTTMPDITILESVVELLDLVTYSSSVLDLAVLEDGDIDLDLITYTVNVPDITVLESVIEPLDLVTYSIAYPMLTITEDSDIALDLVVFTSVVNDVLLVSPYDDITTPLSRIYSLPREYRVFAIVKGKRIMPVAFRSRVYPIR